VDKSVKSFPVSAKHWESNWAPAFCKWEKFIFVALQVLKTILIAHLGNTSSLQEWQSQREDNIQIRSTETETQPYALLGNWLKKKIKIFQSISRGTGWLFCCSV